MLLTLKKYRIARNLLRNEAISAGVIQVALSLVIMLWLTSVSAAPASVITDRLLHKSANNPDSAQSVLDPASLIENVKKKLAATKAEFAGMPLEVAAGNLISELSGDEKIFVRRLQLRQLVFIYQGQISRLYNLQIT